MVPFRELRSHCLRDALADPLNRLIELGHIEITDGRCGKRLSSKLHRLRDHEHCTACQGFPHNFCTPAPRLSVPWRSG